MNNIIVMMAVKTADGEQLPSLLFWPIFALFVALFALMFLLYLRKRAPKAIGICIYVAIVLCIIATIVCIALIGKYYVDNIKNDGYYSPYFKDAPMYISAIVLIGVIIGLTFLLGKNTNFKFDSRSVAFGAVCIAMSFALSYVRLFKLPQGGSVTLASLLPLMIFSYVFGVKKGLLVGLIYGVLQAIQDPYIIHPVQFLLDYPIAFSAIGLSGAFANFKVFKKYPQVSLLLGGILASVLRFLAHFLSGAFAFGAYANDAGQNIYIYSLAYNSFVFVDIAIVLAVGMILFSSKAFINEVVYKQRAKTVANQIVANQVNIAVEEVCCTQQNETSKDKIAYKDNK
ncbi:MAG: energy-coupled thiamine transporter ThiT [Clostridia bacterium]|nr:energy-coupled thiamine transporter ThiT [Clostridia bacterium]